MYLSPLAHNIMVTAGEHNILPGQMLPEKAFDLFLTEENAGDALTELYTAELLQEIPHEVDILTHKGFEYIQKMCKKPPL
ncbi:TPA: hypothetical protein JAN03_07230 [Citrobacter freundii]|nr:hypothetical protein [Citrobacter freundii]